MSFMHNRYEPNDSKGKDLSDMHFPRQAQQKSITYVDTRVEMNEAVRNLTSGEIVVFRDIDPEILQWLIDFEWTDADEKIFDTEADDN
jgi:hypothetical protein